LKSWKERNLSRKEGFAITLSWRISVTDCIFCGTNELAEKSVFQEYEDFSLILDPKPVSFGHIIIVPGRHIEKIDDLDTKEVEALLKRISEAKEFSRDLEKVRDKYFEILKAGDERSEEVVKSVIGNERTPDGFNIGVNDGEAAGQTIDHLHIHVIPRFEEDVEDPEGGVRNVIPEKGEYS
jgi:histidine triad (HIT) family protein